MQINTYFKKKRIKEGGRVGKEGSKQTLQYLTVCGEFDTNPAR